MKLVKRASFGWPASGGSYANPTKGTVVHYDGSDQGLAKKGHAACVTYWKNTRKFHMGPNRKWADIGYAWGVCPHGYVFEGRGLNKAQAAQPGGNTTWYSCTFMSGPNEKPTSLQLQAFADLRKWLASKKVAGAISYHGRFTSTSCPGGNLRQLVTSGALAKVKPTGSTSTSGAKSSLKAPSGAPALREGSSGTRPRQLQKCLNKVIKAGLAEDGEFGPKTEAALKKFQRGRGRKGRSGKALVVDGVYGANSQYALDKALD